MYYVFVYIHAHTYTHTHTHNKIRTYIHTYTDMARELRAQSFFGTKPTEAELAERKAKREAAVASRLMAITHFELELEALAEKQTVLALFFLIARGHPLDRE